MNPEIRRGDVCWARLDPSVGHEQGGTRPVLVISKDVFNRKSRTVIALPLTSAEPRVGFPLNMEVKGAGLPKRSWAKVSQVRTISTRRIEAIITSIDAAQVDAAIEALNEIVGG